MLETAALLPLLIGLLAGLVYIGRLSTTALALGAKNRSCAHRIALDGCRAIPPECVATPSERGRSAEELASERRLEETLAETEASGPTNDAVSTLLGSLFGASTSVESVAEVERPETLKGGKVAVERRFEMPCAPVPTKPEDVARATLERLAGSE